MTYPINRRNFLSGAAATATLLIEPQTYLNALLRDFYIAGGKVVVRSASGLKTSMNLSIGVVKVCVATPLEMVTGPSIVTLPNGSTA